jgi:endo-1,4-beta-xylanase
MNHRQITRRLAIALGLSTFAGVSVSPLLKLENLSQQAEAVESGTQDFTVVGNASLRDRAAAKRFLFGAATGYHKLTNDAALNTKFRQDCAILMAEEDLLWGALRPDADTFAFAKGDWLIDYARQHKMLVGATHLVWHEYMPQWLEAKLNKQNAEQILLQHINKVVTRYTKKIHFWSVVNEAILTSDKRPDGLRKTPWLEFLGPDYIEMAFRAAAAADPQALLLYNDNALEYDIPYHDERRAAVLKWLERLKSKDTPIHGLGLQSHIGKLDNFSPKKLKTFLRDVASLGLKIVITEMDVGDAGMPTDIKVRDRMVAEVYKQFLSVVLEEPAVLGAITWGLSDKYTWLSNYAPREDGTPVRSLPYDAEMNRKLAWNGIALAFEQLKQRRKSSKLWLAWRRLQTQV